MKTRILLGVLLLSGVIFSQNLIDNKWQFSTGDSIRWKETLYNSNHWKTIQSGLRWEEQGFADYNGFAWYRKSILIPESLKKEALKNGGFNLQLGMIDDAAQVYLNGKLVTETGKLPPAYIGAYDKITNCDIPVQDIAFGKLNTIAIRVYDDAGNGGLMTDNTWLLVKGLKTSLKIIPIFPSENQIFTDENNVDFSIKLDNSSVISFKGIVEFRLVNDFKEEIQKWTMPLKVGPSKVQNLIVKKMKYKPGFYTLHLSLNSSLNNISQKITFGVCPEKIVSPTDRQPDFENFWMRAKRELAAVDPQFKMIRQDSLCNDKREVFLVEMRSLDNLLIRGWYARPKSKGKFPASLFLQGYSSNQKILSAKAGTEMPEFLLNVRGHGNSRDELNPGFPGYLQHNVQDKERYIYRGAYMDCIRAVDFLCSRPEVDTRYLVVQGGSQGGALSIATAALDNERVKLCIPSVPFLSDFPDYFKVASWPGDEFSNYLKKDTNFSREQLYENLSYFDIKNLAPMVKCPVFMAVGLVDTTCPPHINFAAYNQLNVPKSYHVYPNSGHGLPSEYSKLKNEWLNTQLQILKNSTK